MVGKPSPAIYRSACQLLGVDPAEAMMVGDDPESDLAPARAIGMRTCLVRTGKGAAAGAADVDLDLPDLAALPAALGSTGVMAGPGAEPRGRPSRGSGWRLLRHLKRVQL